MVNQDAPTGLLDTEEAKAEHENGGQTDPSRVGVLQHQRQRENVEEHQLANLITKCKTCFECETEKSKEKMKKESKRNNSKNLHTCLHEVRVRHWRVDDALTRRLRVAHLVQTVLQDGANLLEKRKET